jgi:hypothetical protein
MRSWILPGTIAGLMQLSRLIGDGPAYYLPLIATALALLASAPVLCCFLWARRWYGPVPALAGGIVVAVAPELVYFGGRALTEVVAAHILIVGCWLLDPGYAMTSRRRLFAAGLLFGLVCLLRIHSRRPRPRSPPCASGEQSWRGARRRPRRDHGRSNARLGARLPARPARAQPALQPCRRRQRIRHLALGIPPFETIIWPPALVLALVPVRRAPPGCWPAARDRRVHSAIPHKEYRFIYPASSG